MNSVYDDRVARPVPTGDVEIVFPPGQTPGPNPNPIPGPIPPIQTSATRRPMRPIVPFRPSRISAFCRDLTIPGRPFDCAANADRHIWHKIIIIFSHYSDAMIHYISI
jgi:hypothetical protein